MLLNSGGIVTVIGKPPVAAMRMPRQISMVPRVTTKEWSQLADSQGVHLPRRRQPPRVQAGGGHPDAE